MTSQCLSCCSAGQRALKYRVFRINLNASRCGMSNWQCVCGVGACNVALKVSAAFTHKMTEFWSDNRPFHGRNDFLTPRFDAERNEMLGFGTIPNILQCTDRLVLITSAGIEIEGISLQASEKHPR